MLPVHHVITDNISLDRSEGAGADMKGHLCMIDAFLFQSLHYCRGEVQPCRGSCHRTADACIGGLIGRFVALFVISSQIRRDGHVTHALEYLGK